MVKLQTIDKLRKYPCASFAIWSDNFGTDNYKSSIEYEILHNKIDKDSLIKLF